MGRRRLDKESRSRLSPSSIFKEGPSNNALEGNSARVEREFVIDNLLVRIHFIIVMIRWTGLAPWEFEFPFPGSLTSSFLVPAHGDPPSRSR